MSPLLILALLSAIGTTSAGAIDNCTSIYNCDDCVASNCNWVSCETIKSCQVTEVSELCYPVPCPTETPTTDIPSTTVEPVTTDPPTTLPPTTEAPTTLPPTTEAPTTLPPTTEAPTTLPPTTEAPTTVEPTDPPTTLPPTTLPPATTEAPTEPPTEPPTTETPTTHVPPAPTPSGRHFDAASFFGGMVLAVAIMAVAYAAWHFYKSRNGRSYRTL